MDEENVSGRRHEHPRRRGEMRFKVGPHSGAMRGFPDAHGFEAEDDAELGGTGLHGMGFPGGPAGRRTPRPHGPAEFGPWAKGRRRGRAKRGNVRVAALALLAEEPMNGYQIIQQISERSGGVWQPSPGSVYPALAQLEDEGLIAPQATRGARRAYELTDEGRDYVAAHQQELREPWSAMAGGAASAAADMHRLVQQVHLAAIGVISAGTEDQVNQARAVLAQTRRTLYRILAEDDVPSAEAGRGTAADPAPASQASAGNQAGPAGSAGQAGPAS